MVVGVLSTAFTYATVFTGIPTLCVLTFYFESVLESHAIRNNTERCPIFFIQFLEVLTSNMTVI